jgi:hypothetical protein
MCQVENAFVNHRHILQGNVKDLNQELAIVLILGVLKLISTNTRTLIG